MKTCLDCNKQIKIGTRCNSCAIRNNWRNGVYTKHIVDTTATSRWCSICNVSHPWNYGESNEHWLMRKKDGSKYECRVNRRNKYLERRKDPRKKLRKAVSNLIRDCIKKHNAFKQGSFPKYVDWTVEELKIHLESQFTEGMSWDNYGKGVGKWSIDHVVPDSFFNYKKMGDDSFKKSWSLDNLQPMWDVDNCAKGNKLEE